MALQKLQHTFPARPQLAPHKWTEPVYGQKRQFAKADVTSPLLNKKGIKRVQRIVGIFLYYGRAIDNTILPTLDEISGSQAAPTEKEVESPTRIRTVIKTRRDRWPPSSSSSSATASAWIRPRREQRLSSAEDPVGLV